MRYVVKAQAYLDLKGHWHYIAHDNPEAADRLLEAAKETFELIARDPEIGSVRSFRKLVGVRSKAVNGFGNYLVFYKNDGKKVVIIRVLHGMRDLPKFFLKPDA